MFLSYASDHPKETDAEEHLPTTTISTVSKSTEVVQDTATGSGVEEGVQKTELEPKGSLLHTKLSMIQMEQFKQRQIYKVEPVAKGVHPDIHNFSLESKRETEYVSASLPFGSKSKMEKMCVCVCY